MLLDDCQQLNTSAKNVTDLRSNVNELKNFQDRQKDLETILSDLNPLVEAFRVFKARGLRDFTLLAEAENFLTLVIEVENQFKNDHKWLISPKKIKPLQEKAKALKDSIEKQLRQQWIAYRKSRVPDVSKDFLSVLERLPKFSKTVATIQSLSSQIEIQILGYPQNQVQFEKVEAAITQLTDSWKNLNSNEVPPDVLNFLKDAATINGASMNLLTPTVQEWLDSQEIGSSFRIRLG